VVIAIHGASPMGALDPRWVQLCRGIAEAGFLCLAPQIASICRLRLSSDQVDEIEMIVKTLRPESGERVGLFSVSFSGGLSLLAASRPSLRGHISAILPVGAFARSDRPMRWLMRTPEADPYGAMLVLANYLPLAIGSSPMFHEALSALA